MPEQIRPRLDLHSASKREWTQIIDLVHNLGGKNAIELLTGRQTTEPSQEPIVQTKVEETKTEINIDLFSESPVTVEDIIRFRNIDTTLWEATRIISNHWPVGAKLKDGNGNWFIAQKPLNQLKVVFNRKKDPGVTNEDIKTWALEAAQSFPVDVQAPQGWSSKTNHFLEIMIPDLHIGKVGIDDEWDFERIQKVWFASVNEIIARAGRVDTIYLPIGNDFIHIDSLNGTTTHGTKLEFAKQWFQLLIFGKQLVLDTIAMLPGDCDIVMPFVPGNHDEHTVLSMSEMIREAVKGESRIVIPEASISGRTYAQEGNVFLGWMHGQQVNGNNILSTVSHEAAEIWGKTKYRYIRLGHLHKSERQGYLSRVTESTELKGLEIEICPSLAPADNWHNSKGFIGNQRRATGFLYDRDRGKTHQFFTQC